MSISSSNIKRSISLCLLLLAVPVGLMRAQGSSIPKTSAARRAEATLPELLPDSVKYRYPLINGLTVSVNVYEPIMQIFINDYASYEATAALDLHHRFFPEFTFGMGHCNELSDDQVRYRVKATPYYKAGIRYNFQFNSLTPQNYYSVLLRYGFSHSTADISNLTYTDGYWGEYGPVNIDNQSFNSHWLEIGFGIKVQIWQRFSMGWDLYFKPMFHKGSTRYADPYYVPGYGTRVNKFGVGYHLYYDIF